MYKNVYSHRGIIRQYLLPRDLEKLQDPLASAVVEQQGHSQPLKLCIHKGKRKSVKLRTKKPAGAVVKLSILPDLCRKASDSVCGNGTGFGNGPAKQPKNSNGSHIQHNQSLKQCNWWTDFLNKFNPSLTKVTYSSNVFLNTFFLSMFYF